MYNQPQQPYYNQGYQQPQQNYAYNKNYQTYPQQQQNYSYSNQGMA